MRRNVLLFIVAATFVACQPTQPKQPPEPLKISRIETSAEPIEEGKPLPEFTRHFATGATAIYSYVWLENAESMTGSFSVRMRWHYPNDLRPPIASRDIGMEPGQTIAQFSLHNEDGLDIGPYQLLVYAGKSASELTASGSARFFIGMTPEEAAEFLEQEAAFIKARDEERARREMEREEQEVEKAGSGPSALQSDSGQTLPVQEGDTDRSHAEEESLPPSLTDGTGKIRE